MVFLSCGSWAAVIFLGQLKEICIFGHGTLTLSLEFWINPAELLWRVSQYFIVAWASSASKLLPYEIWHRIDPMEEEENGDDAVLCDKSVVKNDLIFCPAFYTLRECWWWRSHLHSVLLRNP
jgi:hypothetical protein